MISLAVLSAAPSTDELDELKKPDSGWAAADELPPLTGTYIATAQPPPEKSKSTTQLATARPRTGRTKLAPGKTARHVLEGETASGFYHEQATTPNASSLAINQMAPPTLVDRRLSAVKGVEAGSRVTIVPPPMGHGTPSHVAAESLAPLSPPRKSST